MDRITLPERLFSLRVAAEVDRMVAKVEWCAIFKAGTSDKTVDAWLTAQRVLEPRVDVAVGLILLPGGRPASDHVAALTGVTHRSPQIVLLQGGRLRFHLDEFEITADALSPLLGAHLPAAVGPPVRNDGIVTVAPYRTLLADYVDGRLPEERFQWAYLERLEKEARWRDEATFELLNALFENPWQREIRAARVVALEFQGQLAGRLEPLKHRASRLLERLPDR